MSYDNLLVRELVESQRRANAPEMRDPDYFELFAADQILRNYPLDMDDLEAGWTGGGYDGGIDSLYIFANGDLVNDDAVTAPRSGQLELKLYLIQAKFSEKYDENVLHHFRSVAEDIFDRDGSLEGKPYNKRLKHLIRRFQEIYWNVSANAALYVEFHYVNLGTKPPGNFRNSEEKIKRYLRDKVPRAKVDIRYHGASDLLEAARLGHQTEHELTCVGQPLSLDWETGFVCLVRLGDYFRFIYDDKQKVARYDMLETNVRDYLGANNRVNERIQETLQGRPNGVDFWWLNNGITIVATKADVRGTKLRLQNAEVVNGLQTSSVILDHFTGNISNGEETRCILVRVIVIDDPQIRDQIIRATNSQTKVDDYSLRALEKIHRDIEDYFRKRGLYYERRKAFYRKRERKSPRDIITVVVLAQALLAVVRRLPDEAKARPSDMFRDTQEMELEYRATFNADFPPELYYRVALLYRKVDTFIRTSVQTEDFDDARHLTFHILMYASSIATHAAVPTMRDLAECDVDSLTEQDLHRAVKNTIVLYQEYGGIYQVAKGQPMREALSKLIEQEFS